MSPPRDPRSLPERVRSSIAYARRLARVVDLGPVRLPAFLLARRLAPLRRVPFRFGWRGHHFLARPADEAAIQEVLLDEEYAAAARLVAAAPDRPVVIDAGANIGLFAMVMLAARPDARVHSLEPEAATFALLEANARANPAFAWRAHRLAVWRAAGPVAFGAMDASTSSRIDELAPGGRVEMVEAVTLEYRRHADTKFAEDRRSYRRAWRDLRRKHAALYARRGELAARSALGPAGRAVYRWFWGPRPVPAAAEAALHRALWRRDG